MEFCVRSNIEEHRLEPLDECGIRFGLGDQSCFSEEIVFP